MEIQNQANYQRIAQAIQYLKSSFRQQPSLEEVAAHVCVSPFHLQRMFTEWAGVSPKQFTQYLSIGHAKALLNSGSTTLADAAFETGLSGTGRLHDLFVKIEGMSPGDWKRGGAELSIQYSFANTPFGRMLVASTGKGICHMAFADADEQAVTRLGHRFPAAAYTHTPDAMHEAATALFRRDWSRLSEVRLHLKATPFQLKVWEALLRVPSGALTTYAQLAGTVGSPAACRAVGTAVGDNPVAFLIPCHRVIKSTGEMGQYHWGGPRKAAMIGWESAATEMDGATRK